MKIDNKFYCSILVIIYLLLFIFIYILYCFYIKKLHAMPSKLYSQIWDSIILAFPFPQIGSCKNVTVMSLRSNKLEFLPDEIGQMQKLRVLNLSDNRYSSQLLEFF